MSSSAAMTRRCRPVQWGSLLLAVSLSVASAVAAEPEESLEQQAIVIKGGEGLPKTLYIAPWKRVGGPLEGGAVEGDIRRETEPLERDLLQRELELQREGYSVDPLSTPPSPGSTVSE